MIRDLRPRPRLRWPLVACALGIALACCAAARAVTIKGVVRNTDYVALSGTTVRVFRAGAGGRPMLIERTKTEGDGSYSISLPPGGPIVRIEYDHPAWHVRVVEEVSGFRGDDQVINKLLPKKEGPKSFDLIVDQIMVYDRIHVVEEFGGVEAFDESEQRQRKAQLRDQYGDRILSIPHPLRRRVQGAEQQEVIDGLSPVQREVVDRLMGDLLFRYGYTAIPIYQLPPPGPLNPAPMALVAPPAPNVAESYAPNLDLYYVPVSQGDGTFAALVTRLPASESPAARLGLEPGDLILELDDQRFQTEADVAAHRFQTKIRLISVRDNRENTANFYIP
jgi:membrane-associated protease RseP (regulator of RpoE activity)